MKKLTKNFTLIELMIVVAIIAVIATIAVPQLLDAQRNSKEKACIASLRTIMSDQETYKTDTNLYGTIAQLAAGGKVNLVLPKAGFTYADLIAVPTAESYAASGVPTTPGSSGKKIYACSSAGTIRTDPAVTTAFGVSNAAGAAAILASTMLTPIVAPNEQAGIDNINNNFPEAK
jgi:type IV pilus assembly protein PilA